MKLLSVCTSDLTHEMSTIHYALIIFNVQKKQMLRLTECQQTFQIRLLCTPEWRKTGGWDAEGEDI